MDLNTNGRLVDLRNAMNQLVCLCVKVRTLAEEYLLETDIYLNANMGAIVNVTSEMKLLVWQT
jgi:hypothetical protein